MLLSNEAIEKAREMDLLTYLRIYEPFELVKISSGRYCTRTHDSLKIDKGKWFWWSRGFGGTSALDYLVRVEGWNFRKAVLFLSGSENCQNKKKQAVIQSSRDEHPILSMPEKAGSNGRVIKYLKARGIDGSIIDFFIDRGLIYESLPYHNAVFVGKDESGKPAYAAIRGTGEKRFVGEAEGSIKEYAFSFSEGNSETLHVFESAIDLLSYYELSANKQNNYLSVSGVYQPNKKDTAYTIPAAVTKFLTQNPHIKTIHICFDNDNAGCKAANALYKQLSPKYEAFIEPPTQGKDYNDQLLYERGLPKTFKTRITKNHNKEDLTK